MAWDFVFDQNTDDTVSDGAGSIVTTETAQTQVYLQFKSKFAQWWGDPQSGSKLADPSSMSSDPVAVQAEAMRTLAVLVSGGVISNPTASAVESPDVPGRVELRTASRDTRTGRVIKTGDSTP